LLHLRHQLHQKTTSPTALEGSCSILKRSQTGTAENSTAPETSQIRTSEKSKSITTIARGFRLVTKQGAADRVSEHDERKKAAPPPPHRQSLFAEDGWLFRVPVFKFIMRQCSNLALACFVTNVDLDFLASSPSNTLWGLSHTWWALFLWGAGGCMAEFRSLASEGIMVELRSLFNSHVQSQYRKDAFNLMDLSTFVLMMIALLLPRLFSEGIHWSAILWSAIAMLAWLRLLRILLLTSLGPFMLMFVRMLIDVARMLVIESFIVVSFTSAIFVLYRAVDPTKAGLPANAAAMDPHDACTPLLSMHGELEW
jgi:hypothetical protein